MALAIDASTPAYVGTPSNVSTLTTASFTPPVGALLVVMFGNGFNTVLQTAPTNTGGAVTWAGSAKVTEAASSCAASIWFGTVTTSASMTVTCHRATGVSGDWGFGCAVVTGQAATQTGATGVNTSTSGTPSKAVTTTAANSLVLGCVANFSNGTVGTAGTNQTLTFNGHAFSFSDTGSGAATWAQFDTRINLASGTSDTINDTAPTGIDYSMVVAEILPAAGGGGTFTDTATGTLTLAGVTTESKAATDATAGTLTLTGAKTESRSGTDATAGTLTLSGAKTESLTGTNTASGTLTLSGAKTESAAFTQTASGTLTLTGATTEALAHADAPVGTLLITGTDTESSTHGFNDTGTGTLILSGAVTEAAAFTQTAAGTLTFSGAASDAHIDSDTASGTLLFSGAGSAAPPATGPVMPDFIVRHPQRPGSSPDHTKTDQPVD